MIDLLERRRLFAVAISGTELRIFGTPGNDVITVRQLNPATLQVNDNGAITNWPDAALNTIRINATNPAALTTGTAGNDTLTVISTAASLLTENCLILGGQGRDTMTGGAGADKLQGDSEGDLLDGGDGADSLDGGSGDNVMRGGGGNDSLTAGTGKDDYDGGGGTDLADYSTRAAALKIQIDNVANDAVPGEFDNVRDSVENIFGGSGNDSLVGSAFGNAIAGNSGNDYILGNGSNDSLKGGAGNDTIGGGTGNDSILGDDGNDILAGGANNDSLSGGNGNDTISGGSGADRSNGDGGNDLIFSSDGAVDQLSDGGAGFDVIDIDVGDPTANAELII